MASELKPCPFCRKPMMLREALWPSEGDTDAIIHADKTDCPMFGFGDGSADGSIVEKWNICSSDDEDDFPSDGSCIRCGSVPRNASGLCNTCLDEDAARLENTRPAPTATDTGLVTVEYQVRSKLNGHWVKDNFLSQQLSPDTERRELVTRSQAEELLAAERAARDEIILRQAKAIEVLEADNAALIHDLNRIKDHETELVNDNAAKDARIKKLEKFCNDLALGYASDKAELEAKLEAAEKALEPFVSFFNEAMKGFTEGYAERTPSDKPVLGWNNAYLLMRHFIEARAVLGGKPSC